MKLNFALILSIIVAIGLVALVSTIIQSSTEKDNLNNALKARTEQIARDSLMLLIRHNRLRRLPPLVAYVLRY